MNILLPTDFSENARNAAAYAFAFFGDTPCTFHLLHTLTAEKNSSGELKVPTRFYSDFEKFLGFLDAKKRHPQHEIKVAFKSNHLIEAVREEVLENKIDLIIMGTKGLGNQKTTFIGKNTSEVMQKVKCPVLAISEKTEFRQYKEILFPTDYKIHYNPKMLDFLFRLLSMSGASVKILEIFKSETEPTEEQVENKVWLQNYFSPKTPFFHPLYVSENLAPNEVFAKNDNIGLITLAAKNLELCRKLLNGTQTHQIPFVGQLPLLVLH